MLCRSLRISGQLPAAIVNGGGDSFWKWKDFQLSRACDLDLGSGCTAYRHASLIDVYLHTKFQWNRRNFLWTDGCTFGWTDVWVLRKMGLTYSGSAFSSFQHTWPVHHWLSKAAQQSAMHSISKWKAKVTGSYFGGMPHNKIYKCRWNVI